MKLSITVKIKGCMCGWVGIDLQIVEEGGRVEKCTITRKEHNFRAVECIDTSETVQIKDLAAVNALLQKIKRARVPIFPHCVVGLDGHTVDMTIRSFSHRVNFHWWVDPPPEQAVLGKIFNDIIALAEAGDAYQRLINTGP
ncbi:MAG: hypothetical protein HQK83_05780 [Fibrobacteria bacterium]|nr:hypothetical protein [Fibrobacteria bacterium]